MEQQARQIANQVNPDAVIQQALNAKMRAYQAREGFDSVLKNYNDNFDNLVNLIGIYRKRVEELEAGLAEPEGKKGLKKGR